MHRDELEIRTRDQLNARRNYFLGVWAGTQLGLQHRELDDYIEEVMLSDFEEPGPFDILGKVQADLANAGIDLESGDLLNRFKNIEQNVRRELLSTD
jgi:hypothetical protein